MNRRLRIIAYAFGIAAAAIGIWLYTCYLEITPLQFTLLMQRESSNEIVMPKFAAVARADDIIRRHPFNSERRERKEQLLKTASNRPKVQVVVRPSIKINGVYGSGNQRYVLVSPNNGNNIVALSENGECLDDATSPDGHVTPKQATGFEGWRIKSISEDEVEFEHIATKKIEVFAVNKVDSPPNRE